MWVRSPLLDQRPRTATVVAITPVSLEVLNRCEFMSLLAQAPELTEQILATIAQRLIDLEGQASTGVAAAHIEWSG
jgi:CRP-like cAMP-binding protein